jgi:hypothetical protein
VGANFTPGDRIPPPAPGVVIKNCLLTNFAYSTKAELDICQLDHQQLTKAKDLQEPILFNLTMQGVESASGRPDRANFRSMGDCLKYFFSMGCFLKI